MCVQLGQILDKGYKQTKNPNATFEDPGAKAGYCAFILHTPWPNGWANHLSRPSGPTPGHTSTLNPCWEQAPPLLQQGTCCLFLLPSACSRGPGKTLSEKTSLSTNSLTPLLLRGVKESLGPREENSSLKGPLLNHLNSGKTKHNFSSILML